MNYKNLEDILPERNQLTEKEEIDKKYCLYQIGLDAYYSKINQKTYISVNDGEIKKYYSFNQPFLPVGAHIVVEDGKKILYSSDDKKDCKNVIKELKSIELKQKPILDIVSKNEFREALTIDNKELVREGQPCVRDMSLDIYDFKEAFNCSIVNESKQREEEKRYNPKRDNRLKECYEVLFDIANVLGTDTQSLTFNSNIKLDLSENAKSTNEVLALNNAQQIIKDYAYIFDYQLGVKAGLNDCISKHPEAMNGLYKNIVKGMYIDFEGKPSEYYLDALRMDALYKDDLGDYRSAPNMFARAFSNYLTEKMYNSSIDDKLPLPKDVEKEILNRAFDKMVEQVKEREIMCEAYVDYDLKLKQELSNDYYNYANELISSDILERVIQEVEEEGIIHTYEEYSEKLVEIADDERDFEIEL